mmetsp:Transcript_7159/g.15648  ORF Transcript_7159/g.15648 Transcript_7159/m.15648 type:complete len:363 (+) Transcript_7159:144-1232(+)|eukprot:CAMPEP_0202893078 /NCGR_PEP_ID=MMETSP1392-20130828/2720_1 /ASSEMBLY_ACC=CAM_ASM_000868 /TAXON_ID=225041 /ORGANISM="Chlamydomonas chlamydogama, Strain SAG 11-48b" /LENGTH=362 /DNA_ID=CAMNT_0049577271 /DNA_START=119 /DNA_END=1207 /DNA_ORIENTATION=+
MKEPHGQDKAPAESSANVVSVDVLSKAQEHVNKFAKADWYQAFQTLGITVALYVGTLIAYPYFCMFGAAGRLAWVLIRGGVMVRTFILSHDCMHNSFFPKTKWNVAIGRLAASEALTPFERWRRGHLFHHQTSGSLEVVKVEMAHKSGDTVFWTTSDWDKLPAGRKNILRFLRDPIVFFSLVPLLIFFVLYRIPGKGRHRTGVTFVNIQRTLEISAVQLLWLGNGFWWMEMLAMWTGASVGVLLFHLQHGVNEGYRVQPNEHDRGQASLLGATFLQVPWWFKWVTLGIEYHHIHHLNAQVPCYKLATCHNSAPPGMWDSVVKVETRLALASLLNVMWNDKTSQYEPFPEYKGVQERLLRGIN